MVSSIGSLNKDFELGRLGFLDLVLCEDCEGVSEEVFMVMDLRMSEEEEFWVNVREIGGGFYLLGFNSAGKLRGISRVR